MITFYKYHGTGNDFIILDELTTPLSYQLSPEEIKLLCHRRFGIGADGLMIISPSKTSDFEMIYFNSDGHTSSMCGNGGRCIAKCFFDLDYGANKCTFEAIDGLHFAHQEKELISLRMSDVPKVDQRTNARFVLDTGSPHYVQFVTDKTKLQEIVEFGTSVRYNDEFASEGINVNQVYKDTFDTIHMATYERGVEAETYSCGTGVVAASLSLACLNKGLSKVYVKTKGGQLSVNFKMSSEGFTEIDLIGPAALVYKGEINPESLNLKPNLS